MLEATTTRALHCSFSSSPSHHRHPALSHSLFRYDNSQLGCYSSHGISDYYIGPLSFRADAHLPYRFGRGRRRSPGHGGGRSTSTVCAAALRTDVQLNQGIAQFYDSSSAVWEEMWGEHMHHGFYDPSIPFWEALWSDHKAAQIRMIEEALCWACIPDEAVARPQKILDVGCGIGGSARYLARKYGANVVGITLSPNQAKRAAEISVSAGLAEKVSFQVADALNQPFPNVQFDLVWSMESGEHMPDKEKFLAELARVTKPGGRIIIVTWCHRELKPDETSLQPDEKDLLGKICDAYYLPEWCAVSKYVNIAESLQLEDIKSADWSQHITPFWPAVVISALSWKGLRGLAKSGWTTIQGAIAMAYMIQGYNSDLIKLVAITARKPVEEEGN